MSDQFPSLAAVVAAHRWVSKSTFSRYRAGCSCGWERDIVGTNRKGLQLHGEHVEQVWREACTVTTVEQLDALPVESVVREILIMPSGRDAGYVWERWNGFEPTWVQMGYPNLEGRPSSVIRLPARVLHNPDWETK